MAFFTKRSSEEDRLLQESLSQLGAAEQHWKRVMDRVTRARRVYSGAYDAEFGSNSHNNRNRRRSSPRDWRSRNYPRIAFELAEVMYAKMAVEDPRFSFTARQAEFAGNARAAEDSLDFYLDRDRFSRVFRMAIRNAIRDGGSVIKTLWHEDSRPAFDPLTGEPMVDDDGDVVTEVLHNGLKNVNCRLEDIFPDPSANSFDKARYVFHRTMATMDDLRAPQNADGSPFYKNLDQLTTTGMGGDSNDEKRDTETEEAFRARREGMHTIHEKWTPYGRLTIANKTTIIRHDKFLPLKHGRVPFTMIRFIDDDDLIVGTSIMNLVDDLQESYWEFFNALSDAVRLAVNPPMLVDIEEDPSSVEYEIKPGARLPARNGEQTVKVIQDIANLDKYNVTNLLGQLRELMERITGMNAAAQGMSNVATASEAAINSRAAGDRIAAMMGTSDESWTRFADRAYQLIQQFGSEEVSAVLVSGKKIAFAPENLSDMLITAKPASTERAVKDLERQDAQSLFELVMSITPPESIPALNPLKAMERLLESHGVDPRGMILEEGGGAAPEDIPLGPEEEEPVGPEVQPRPEHFIGPEA